MAEGESALALNLAREARRTGLLAVLGQLRTKLTIARLDDLLRGKYGEDLAEITVDELCGPTPRKSLVPGHGESLEDAAMRVFEGLPGVRLTSGFFIRHMGLPRWTAQKLLAELAERGLLDREGRTSSTGYRLAGVELEDSNRGVV